MPSMDHSHSHQDSDSGLPADRSAGGGPPPTKTHRASKACFQCRSRKQKCSGPAGGAPPPAGHVGSSTPDDHARLPCRRCSQSAVECSFTTCIDKHEVEEADAASRAARKVDRLQKQVDEQASRIGKLEATVSDLQSAAVAAAATPVHVLNSASPAMSGGTRRWHDETGVSVTSPVSKRPKTRRDESTSGSEPVIFPTHVDFSTPMAMLRHLRHDMYDQSKETEALDPISCGVMTMSQAQQAFDTFFNNCHRWAPVLCPRTQTSAAAVRQACPALFISVCCIGYRFINSATPEAHRRYMALISLLDHSLSRLLLRPNMADVSLDHIRALLLYVQWMPVDHISSPSRSTRYNAISAWSMLGLAIRYALFLGLHQDAVLPFKSDGVGVPLPPSPPPTLEEFGRLRVWINLLTCDAALTLSSGLPATLNPDPVVAVADRFRSHRGASHPDDTRSSATCELVSILKRATRSSGSPNARSLDAACLRQVNVELDAWEHNWNPIIGDQIKHYQMPFTTLRSYRLSINSACLSSLLRPSAGGGPDQTPIYVLQALEVSLHTAALTIFALSEQSKHQPWGHYTSLETLPPGRYTPDTEAINRIKYSVDSTWISYSFAIMLLVLCYKGGIVDQDLKILALCSNSAELVTFPQRQATSSLLYRLVSLATQILDLSSTNLLAHPALDQKALLSGVFAVVLGDLATDDDMPSETPGAALYLDREVEALFDSMVDNMDVVWYAE